MRGEQGRIGVDMSSGVATPGLVRAPPCPKRARRESGSSPDGRYGAFGAGPAVAPPVRVR